MDKKKISLRFAIKPIYVHSSKRNPKWIKIFMNPYYVEKKYSKWSENVDGKLIWKWGWKKVKYYKNIW